MTPAELLREAANRIERTAADTTPGPWFADEDDNCWTLHGYFEDPLTWDGFVGATKQILKAPKRNTPYAEYWPEQGDADWITTMHPGIAAPLAAWLRAEAVIAGFDDNLRYNLSLNLSPEAVAFARSILREEP